MAEPLGPMDSAEPIDGSDPRYLEAFKKMFVIKVGLGLVFKLKELDGEGDEQALVILNDCYDVCIDCLRITESIGDVDAILAVTEVIGHIKEMREELEA